MEWEERERYSKQIKDAITLSDQGVYDLSTLLHFSILFALRDS